MKKQIKWVKNILLASGVIEITAGLLHFFMPDFLYQSNGFAQIRPHEVDFVTIGVLAIGILLLSFGSITILFSLKMEISIEMSFTFAVIKTLLWLGRVILEIVYPVNLKLFFIEPFTAVALPLVMVEMFLFAVSAMLIKNIMHGAQKNVD